MRGRTPGGVFVRYGLDQFRISPKRVGLPDYFCSGSANRDGNPVDATQLQFPA